ncbi:unnamed protein product [Ilex paraguariensis]|uniref:Uncharacterized protein n=1 Tax=Ilex paraguariensis TaxID=185542 RepID=A0ABC8TNW2_9AQUA
MEPYTGHQPPLLQLLQPHKPKTFKAKTQTNFNLIFPFNIPLTPEAAAVRIIRNLGYFRLYYTMFIWVILFITLMPKRKLSLCTCSCYVHLPDSIVLHRIIDKRFDLSLMTALTAVDLILTGAAIHLFFFVNEEVCAAGELVPLVYDKAAENDKSPIWCVSMNLLLVPGRWNRSMMDSRG